jgi:hypothetical protein
MPNELDFYEEVALKLIGIEVELSRRFKNLPPGYTTGKARIKRYLLKQKYHINSNFQLESLRDALAERGYALIEFEYQSDFFLINIKNFLVNTRIISPEEIDGLNSKAIGIALQYFEAIKNRKDEQENV